MSVLQQEQTQVEHQRPYSTSPERNTGQIQFSNVFDIEGQREKSYGTINENEKKLDIIPGPIAILLGSTYCFFTLCILLIFPILQVAFGAAYRDQCTINSNIPTYLVVNGACGMVTIFLILVVVGAFIWCIKKESLGSSFVTLCIAGFVFFTVFLMSLFLFAWFIAGNVWVFGAKSNVVYDDVTSPNYCNRTLYQFAFTMLILTYVMPVISCCFSCVRTCCSAGKT